MSLRDFKQTLASLPPDSQHAAAAASWGHPASTELLQRKPPKSTLKDQIAFIERQAAELACTTTGDTLPPPPTLYFSPSPPRLQRNLSHSPPISHIRPPKRTKLSDYAPALVEGVLLHDQQDHTFFQLHQKTEASVSINGLNQKDELARLPTEGQLEWEKKHEEEQEEGGNFVARGDSEAGLFIHSEIEVSQEPLVLWPPEEEESTDGLVQVPSSINGRLMEHQREGVKFLYRLYRDNQGGVLGDDMGLGKTIQVIAFLSAVLQSDHSNEDNNHKMPKGNKQVLIVAPTSVLRNWEQEFHAWGTFEVAIYHGVHREAVVSRLEAKSLQIILTSFDTFRIHGESLCMIEWDCMVVDEAHRLKNDKSDLYVACTKVPTKRRYGLTGTIMQNKIMDLFNVFDWANPGCLGTREHFRQYYDEPLKQGQRISAPKRFVKIAEERMLLLVKKLEKFLLRREKHETIGHLMMGKEDNVIFCEMSPLQRRVYKRLLASPDFQCLMKKDEPCTCGSPLKRAECCYRMVPRGIIWRYFHKEDKEGCGSCPYCLVLPCLTKLQQVSNHLELIKPNSKDDPEKQKKDELLAEYVFAEDSNLVGGTAQDESFLGLSDTQHCGKMKALELLLAHWVQQGDKVLVFSYSVRMLDILDKFLIRKGYCFSRLDGSTAMSMRQSLVDEFNRSPSKQVFLISTRAGGLGLNLVGANRVVIFDPNWNPAQDLQAQDRSFRYGQRRHVTVYRLLAAGSLEELVYTRQIYKQQLFNIAVSGSLEKRYFDGVQDSKDNKGELFGISNLFRDLSDQAFTSEIIEKHETRVLSFQVKRAMVANNVFNGRRNDGALAGDQKDREASKPVVSVKESRVALRRCSTKQRADDKLAMVLKEAGVIYAHRNEDVVSSKSTSKKHDIDSHSNDRELKSDACPVGAKKPALNTSKRSKDSSRRGKFVNKPLLQSESRCIQEPPSKEEQFAALAKFKGMDKTQFSKWLLSVSDAEKQKLLLDFKQQQK